ncbi:hypothetical protein DFP73DRAFT_538783 [Morchella snyderi]|nr:hypothetical protein DFP73DRAFT_538783 [Morchella snyderi]
MKRGSRVLNSLPRRNLQSQWYSPRCLHRGLQTSASFTPKTIFSGIQPTGVPHLGNYLGALKQWANFQNTETESTKLIFCIVDLHAITSPQKASNLRQWKKEMLTTLLAIGLNPERCIIFEQSRVPAHSELMWILSCIASTGRLSRMTQWKSKLGISEEHHSLEDKSTAALKLGLFSYPVLQAADILVHRATHVPVGEDQAQHLELTRDIVGVFHHTYGEVFPLPATLLSPAKRVMSLSDPTKKMSKSAPDLKSRILLTDSPTSVRGKIKVALTDSLETHGITYDPQKRPGLSNLIEIYAHIQGREDFGHVAGEFEGLTKKVFKERVAECINESLESIRSEYMRITETEGDGFLEKVIKEGSAKAANSAEVTMIKVRKALGLL